jgi:hypothetical protein
MGKVLSASNFHVVGGVKSCGRYIALLAAAHFQHANFSEYACLSVSKEAREKEVCTGGTVVHL